jgi:hypothetical protein
MCTSSSSREELNLLIRLLKKNGHPTLPFDVRTLLKIPRNILTEDKCGGQYAYMGIEKGILEFANFVCKLESNFQLKINIDGLPLFRSSNAQLWPILCIVSCNNLSSVPFVVGLFCGQSKPNSLNDYLHDFINELNHLCRYGIEVNGRIIKVSVESFICDAPARSWLKCTKTHNGYYSCERCIAKGKYEAGRVVMTDLNAKLRTNVKFAKFKYRYHHQESLSPLVKIDCPLVSGFVLDYMHLVCLGVMRRLLHFWCRGKNKFVRLSSRDIQQLSTDIVALRRCVPVDFARKPRSLKELDRWKATELRMFLLYIGPVVLKKYLSTTLYEHFLCLSIAIALLSTRTEKTYVEHARKLLVIFVR